MNVLRSRLVSPVVMVILSLPFGLLAQSTAPASPAPAAAPAAGAMQGQGRPRGPRPKPTNIQALPKDISGDDVIKVMHAFEQELGVECEYCHAVNPATKRIDAASDANPKKDVARTMIRMTSDINSKYLSTLGTDPAPKPVTCGTCHRGQAKPAEFVLKQRGPGGPPPAGGAVAAPPAKPPL